MNNLYGPFDYDDDDDDDDFDDDEDFDDDDDDDDGWNGHFGEDDGLDDDDDDKDDDDDNDEDDDKDEDKDDDGEGDGFGEDIGDGFGDEQNPDGTDADNPDDEDGKKKKKRKNDDEDVDVEGKGEFGGENKRIEKAIKRNANTFTTWAGMLAVGNHPVATCPSCHRKSIYMSKTATDLLTFGLGAMIIGVGFRFVFFCMNNYDECKYSYQNGKCFFSETAKPTFESGARNYPLAMFRNCDKKSVKKKKR